MLMEEVPSHRHTSEHALANLSMAVATTVGRYSRSDTSYAPAHVPPFREHCTIANCAEAHSRRALFPPSVVHRSLASVVLDATGMQAANVLSRGMVGR